MKNNMSFSKPFILLGLVIILSIVLFSSYNKYSLENFRPKPNIKLEVTLWVSALGSLHNIFVRSQWLEFVNKYDKFPNIEFAKDKAVNFVKYLDLDKNPDLATFQMLDYVRPPYNTFVSIVIVNTENGIKHKFLPTALISDTDLTFESLTMQLNRVFTDYYDTLYDNSPSDSGNAMPALPEISGKSFEMPNIPTIPTTIPNIPAMPQGKLPDWLKIPG